MALPGLTRQLVDRKFAAFYERRLPPHVRGEIQLLHGVGRSIMRIGITSGICTRTSSQVRTSTTFCGRLTETQPASSGDDRDTWMAALKRLQRALSGFGASTEAPGPAPLSRHPLDRRVEARGYPSGYSESSSPCAPLPHGLPKRFLHMVWNEWQ